MQIQVNAATVCLAISLLIGCSSTIVQCKLDALENLPDDPFAVSGHDVSNLIARLQNCRDQPTADAGSP
jgi:hypothetical protein